MLLMLLMLFECRLVLTLAENKGVLWCTLTSIGMSNVS